MSTKYPDAIGYLNDLAQDVGEGWFTMICDLAVKVGTSSLGQHNIDTLLALFTQRASYLGMNRSAATLSGAPTATSTADFLEVLQFSNFKLLDDNLKVVLTKRITVIFGANGSGKSSICEALKILASLDSPVRPLNNARVDKAAPAAFTFKFRSDSIPQLWTQASGYGLRRSTVKYFDTGIALQNVEKAVEPGRIIILTPFKLHVFEWVKALTASFREVLRGKQAGNAEKLTQALEKVRVEFQEFSEYPNEYPLTSINEKKLSVLSNQIMIGETFTQHELLKEKQAAVSELEKAASEEGLRLLKAEHNELRRFLTSLKTLLDSAEGLWALQPVKKAKELEAKLSAQELLAKKLIPENGTLKSLMALLHAASPLYGFETAEYKTCPLCKRTLGAYEIELFKQYHELLMGELEKQILQLRADLDTAKKFVKTATAVDRKEWDLSGIFPSELLSQVKTDAELILTNCNLIQDPTDEACSALASLKVVYTNASKLLEQKANAIKSAIDGREKLLKQLEKLCAEIKPLQYAELIKARLPELKESKSMADEAAFWNSKLPLFTPLSRKITDAAKAAYGQLVVSGFKARLDAEYRVLTEMPMAAFGVDLVRKGSDASVTVVPRVGGKELEGVLSEGEQRVHALALFFAELETCQQSVVVFDDPVSSFDYNYIANYCIRLRDFALKYSERQIIVLTHNWEFFVQLQRTLNRAGFDGQLSVQVLENCAIVADYSEKIDELKKDIEKILGLPGEPIRAQKEEMASKMRRLIEAVVNTHVFNNQRHQYKQKSQQVSEFNKYTKLVPLLPAEATTFRDLYAKLSVSEHDDPRNAYVNTDKAIFQARYDSILEVANNIQSRRVS